MTHATRKTRHPIASLAAISALILGAKAASAGDVTAPPPDPIVITAPPAPAFVGGRDWTGPYIGLQLGYGDVDSTALNGDSGMFGFHSGFDYDFGSYVLGGEVDFDQADISLSGGAATIDTVGRAKLKGGYDLGDILIYGTVGYALANTSVGDEEGLLYGIGAVYHVNERYSIGAELLEHRFDSVGGVAGNDLDVTTLTLRGSLRF